jgi:hypothetical protein
VLSHVVIITVMDSFINVAAGAVAHGVFVDSAYTASNFGQLRVVTSADYTDLHQLKAAGWLEGYLTAGACHFVPLLARLHPTAPHANVLVLSATCNVVLCRQAQLSAACLCQTICMHQAVAST